MSKEMMPSVGLPNNGRGRGSAHLHSYGANHRARERQAYQQVITIIGSLYHQILPAQVTSLSFQTALFSPVKLQSSNCRLLDSRRTTFVCAYSYTISYARLLSKLTPSNITWKCELVYMTVPLDQDWLSDRKYLASISKLLNDELRVHG